MNLMLYLSTVLIWGSTWIAIAWQLGPIPIEVSVLYRFALAALALFALLTVSGRFRACPGRASVMLPCSARCSFPPTSSVSTTPPSISRAACRR
jgi:uncharacterized membrane protein